MPLPKTSKHGTQIKAVKSAGVQVSTNPDTFVRLDTPDAIGLLQDIKNEHLTYMVWKKVPVEINGKTKEKNENR